MLEASRVAAASSSNRLVLRSNIGKLALVGTGVAFLTVLVLLPLAAMFQYASGKGIGVFWESISSPEAVFSLKFTIILAVAAALINAVMGTLVAFMLVRHEFPLKVVLDSLVDLPLATPAAATGFTILILYAPSGILGRGCDGAGINIMFAFPAILIAHVFMTLPFVVRAVGPLLEKVDTSQEEVAKTMGANQAQIFLNVILPSIRAGLISGCIFTFARSMGEFGATMMVSGILALRTQTAPMFIFSDFNRGEIEAASSMSAVLVIVSLTLFLGWKLVIKTGKRGTTIVKRDSS